MYTGTLIADLIATVNHTTEQQAEQQLAEELHEIFTMQIPVANSEQTFMGAA
jgi:hypothetical protein